MWQVVLGVKSVMRCLYGLDAKVVCRVFRD